MKKNKNLKNKQENIDLKKDYDISESINNALNEYEDFLKKHERKIYGIQQNR